MESTIPGGDKRTHPKFLSLMSDWAYAFCFLTFNFFVFAAKNSRIGVQRCK